METPKEWFQKRSCQSKVRFRDRSHAMAVRRGMSERLRVYYCKQCNGYHVAHADAPADRIAKDEWRLSGRTKRSKAR